MSKLKRFFRPGQSCFITAVTDGRRSLLVKHSRLFAKAVIRAGSKSDFGVTAWVVMPDHFHMIIYSPNGDISKIMQRIKLSFQGQYKSRTRCNGSVWQAGFWDHIIRSPEDMNRHIDYIRYNPVKHGLVDAPYEYGLSSFRRFCRAGQYDLNWRDSNDKFGGFDYGE